MDVNFATDCICLQVGITVLVGVDMFPFWQDMFPRTGTKPDINQKVSCHVEGVVLLSKLDSKNHISVELPMDDMDLTSAESKAIYKEIQNYVLEKFGFKIPTLYTA